MNETTASPHASPASTAAPSAPSAPAPGWYPDPYDLERRQRWWDGHDWTDHDAPLSSTVNAVPSSDPRPAADYWQCLRHAHVDRENGTNAAASMSLATGIAALVAVLIPLYVAEILGLACGVLAVVWGIIALHRVAGGSIGTTRAIVGLALGALSLLVYALATVLLILQFA